VAAVKPSPRRSRAPRVAAAAGVLLLLAGIALLALPPPLPAQESERRVKAAFLYRFTEFVSWPDAAFARTDSPFVITVIGRDVIADELRGITAARSVGGRAVEVRRAVDAEGAAGAQILFIGDTERARLRELVRLAPKHALVVTESEGALAQGSVINFVVVENRVRFEIALDAAEKRALRLSSRLLAVAQAVRSVTP
jgi:hypothetical protein